MLKTWPCESRASGRLSGRTADARAATHPQGFIKEQPLKGVRLAACLHVTSETANLAITLPTAEPIWFSAHRIRFRRKMKCGLAGEGLFDSTYAIKGEDNGHVLRAPNAAVDHQPQMTMTMRGSRDPASHEARAPVPN